MCFSASSVCCLFLFLSLFFFFLYVFFFFFFFFQAEDGIRDWSVTGVQTCALPISKRLLERVCSEYERFFDVVTGDALYFDAPFINFCLAHHKDVIVVVKGDHRLLLQDAQQLFSQRIPSEWSEGRRTVRYWDEEGFTSCEGVKAPLRVLYTEETVRHRAQIDGQEKEETSGWYWATTLSKNQFPTRQLWQAGHDRWDIENDCFNTLSTYWALDHCFRHRASAIVNFVLTCFIA